MQGFDVFNDVPRQMQNFAHTLLRPRERGDLLPKDYEPTDCDVCCGRGKRNWNHPGNLNFRNFIQSKTDEYMAAPSKTDKTAIVCKIVEDMRGQGCKFINQDEKTGRWFDIGDAQAREKVGHSLRDQVTAINRQIKKEQECRHNRRPSITYSDSGNETGLRRSSFESTVLHTTFARRPSWIAIATESNNYDQMEGIVPEPDGFEVEQRKSSWDDSGINQTSAARVSEEASASVVSDEQIPVLDRIELLNTSVQTWNPRPSTSSSDLLSVHRSIMSSGTTLRRMTNSFRISDLSMTEFLDGVDLSNDVSSSMMQFGE
jgi:hypothetical protein